MMTYYFIQQDIQNVFYVRVHQASNKVGRVDKNFFYVTIVVEM
jgi:hypothetical protein